ncbi:hypothetical protein Trydic_g7611 [Trypoxylus dichotomus]
MEDEEPLTPAVKNAVNFFNSLNKVEPKPKPRHRVVERKIRGEKEENRNIKNTMNLINQLNGELKNNFESKIFKPKFRGGSTEKLIAKEDDKSTIIKSSNGNKPDLVLEIPEKPKPLPKPKPRMNIIQNKNKICATKLPTNQISPNMDRYTSSINTENNSLKANNTFSSDSNNFKCEKKHEDAIPISATKSRIETFNSVLVLKSNTLKPVFTSDRTTIENSDCKSTKSSSSEMSDNHSSILIVKSGSINEVRKQSNNNSNTNKLQQIDFNKIASVTPKSKIIENFTVKENEAFNENDLNDVNKLKIKHNAVLSSKDIRIPKPKFPQNYKSQPLEDELETFEKIFEGIAYSPIKNSQSLEELRIGEKMLEETIKQTKDNIKKSMQCLLEFENDKLTVVKKDTCSQHFLQAFKKSKRSASADDRSRKVKNVQPYDTFDVGSAIFKEASVVIGDSDAESSNTMKKGGTRKKGIYKKIQVNVSHTKER